MKAETVMQEIRAQGKSQADPSVRQIGALAVGDYVAQGDVNFWPLADMPCGAKLIAKPDRQLAPGATKGSRHMIASADMEHCEFFSLPDPNPLQGPVIKMDRPTTVEHPEHGDLRFPPGLVFVTYQRAFAEELRRIED